MKNNYFKVNRRYIFLCLLIAFVVFGIIAYVPRIRAEGLSDIFGAIIPPGAAPGDYNTGWGTTPTPPTYPYPPLPTTTPVSVLTGTPAPIPPGDCTTGLNRALSKLDSVASQVIPVYQQASATTGIPWEIFAAIHYVETGGSFNPTSSLIDGSPIGNRSLLETAISAAQVFKSNYSPQSGPYNDFQKLVRAFSYYNGSGNRQCTSSGTPKPQSRYTGCPRSFESEDDLYPLACFDVKHEHMWLIYCGDSQTCPAIGESIPISSSLPGTPDPADPTHRKIFSGIEYTPRVGTLALIAGIQARNQPTQTPTPPPAGNLRYFNQCDPAYQLPGVADCNKDGEMVSFLCAAGCVPTSVAQVIASYADPAYTPLNAAETLMHRFTPPPDSQPQLTCNGSHMVYQIPLLDQYPNAIEHGNIEMSPGGFTSDAIRLKPYFDAGWTALARNEYTRAEQGNTPRGHYIWITRIDSNNDVWAYDPYFIKTEIVGSNNLQPPLNISALLRGEFEYKGFTSMNITWYVLVRRK